MPHFGLNRRHQPPILELQGFSYQDRDSLVRNLSIAIQHSGGWILQKKHLDGTDVEFRIELQSRGMMEMYSAFVSSGLELTRAGHLAMAESCSILHRLPLRWHQVASIHLIISFVPQIEMEDLFPSSSATA